MIDDKVAILKQFYGERERFRGPMANGRLLINLSPMRRQ